MVAADPHEQRELLPVHPEWAAEPGISCHSFRNVAIPLLDTTFPEEVQKDLSGHAPSVVVKGILPYRSRTPSHDPAKRSIEMANFLRRMLLPGEAQKLLQFRRVSVHHRAKL